MDRHAKPPVRSFLSDKADAAGSGTLILALDTTAIGSSHVGVPATAKSKAHPSVGSHFQSAAISLAAPCAFRRSRMACFLTWGRSGGDAKSPISVH
jgi:hypothetical protein